MLIWEEDPTDNQIYLTFDDGPIPEVTPWVLNELQKRSIEATFFVVGENIKKYPEIFKSVINGGHGVGNHTYNHLNGWNTDSVEFLKNVQLCQNEIETYYQGPRLLRPPYGKVKRSQIKRLSGYKIIMWDYLSGDFDQNITAEEILVKSKKVVKAGSIIVFHDNVKNFNTLKVVLPNFLDHFLEKGYRFSRLSY